MNLVILRRSGVLILVWLIRNILASSTTTTDSVSKKLQNPPLQSETTYRKKSAVQRQIHSIILDLCARHAVCNILGIGDGVRALYTDLEEAGYTVTTARVAQEFNEQSERLFLPNKAGKSKIPPPANIGSRVGFDMAMMTESGQCSFKPAELISFAAEKLNPGGVLILAIPHLSYLKNLLTYLYRWRELCCFIPSSGNSARYWSKCETIQILKLYGFKKLEIIGIRDASLNWNSLIFVARKAFK